MLITDRLRPIAPGLLTSFVVACLAKALGLLLPQLGGATLAILLGILLGNTVIRQPQLAGGTKFAESRLLEYSVCLLGLTVTFQTIGQMGWRGVVYVLLQMAIVLTGAYFIGRVFGFSATSRMMMAGGNAVCGSSAIGAIAPAIGAPDDEKGEIITLVNLLGTVMMLTLPFLGQWLFGANLLAKSALLGGTLQSVGQVVAGASLLSQATVNYAMLFKITRIIMLVVVVTVFTKNAQRLGTAPASEANCRLPIPWYVLIFLAFCILNSAVTLPGVIADAAHFLSGWFETTALAAIGLRLDFKKFMAQGTRFLGYGLSVGTLQIVAAVTLLFLLHV